MSDIGVVYLCRRLDPNWHQRLARFVASYKRHYSGIDHQLYVIYKEFDPDESLLWAAEELAPLDPIEIRNYMQINSYAGGSFLEASHHMDGHYLCCLGSSTEIMHNDWLKKLYDALILPTVGLVCCTGSYGFITEFNPGLSYPNIHIRNLLVPD